MNEAHHIPLLLETLQKKLDAIDGVRAEHASGSEVNVEFKGRRIGTWAPMEPAWQSNSPAKTPCYARIRLTKPAA